VQRLFNGMTGAKATKDKARMVLNQIPDAAVEDGLITKGPLRSKRIKITGKASQPTAPYTVEQMRYQVQHIGDTKTRSSARTIGLSALAVPHLPQVKADEFVFGGRRPLSYTQVRKMCNRIKRDTGFSENITPIRFRTTVLTDL
jgi:hypothetical protein